MKNKGFTLVELLGVIVILAVIFVLIFPSVSKVVSESKETVFQLQINNILKATYDFSLKNPSYLPDVGQKSYITLGELKYAGYVDVNIKDPSTEEKFKDNLVVSIHNVGAGYKYTNENAKLEGDYLYTVEIEKLTDISIKSLLPKITLTGEGVKENSNGNYILVLDLNKELTNINVSALSSKNENLTNKVKQYILLNDHVVENIDSSKSSIYKIYYSVVDNYGYANVSILNIIIADITKPTITLPDSTVINIDIDSYDLKTGVECNDNSGFCDLTTQLISEDTINGKYIIEYTAQDPSGNTTTKKRVITIE